MAPKGLRAAQDYPSVWLSEPGQGRGRGVLAPRLLALSVQLSSAEEQEQEEERSLYSEDSQVHLGSSSL